MFDDLIVDDKPREECGLVGLYEVEEAAQVAALGLHALQHRGQESAGVVSSFEGNLHPLRGLGLVAAVFGQGQARTLPGNA
ncbi:MAG: amidophosphoribosyltransferase, partial [Deltaproteobacteria bacterium]|nr:amidophosphoribosyltransferase [Deltaproteobacteria bacterium]